MNRRERREKARQEKVSFVPLYSNGKGPVTYEEYHGVGYERFNNKFVTIKEVQKDGE